jgi:gamma-glutamyltranspeptidase/glutathione hydrolase/leukotriene-C4 hydrolase
MGVQRDIRTYLYNASILNEGENNNPLRYAVTDHGTSHMTAVDSNRMAVALTSTVNLFFGSHVLSEQTGILYNDQMDDFSIPNATNAYSLPPTEANFIQPGKRPLSSMTPTMVHKNGKFYVTLGGSGGPFILTATMQSLLNIIDFDMDVASAIQKPRIHHQLIPPKLEVETNFPVDALSKILQYDGYEIDVMEGSQENLGVVQGIMLDDNGVLEAASDIRKKSFAAAY